VVSFSTGRPPLKAEEVAQPSLPIFACCERFLGTCAKYSLCMRDNCHHDESAEAQQRTKPWEAFSARCQLVAANLADRLRAPTMHRMERPLVDETLPGDRVPDSQLPGSGWWCCRRLFPDRQPRPAPAETGFMDGTVFPTSIPHTISYDLDRVHEEEEEAFQPWPDSFQTPAARSELVDRLWREWNAWPEQDAGTSDETLQAAPQQQREDSIVLVSGGIAGTDTRHINSDQADVAAPSHCSSDSNCDPDPERDPERSSPERGPEPDLGSAQEASIGPLVHSEPVVSTECLTTHVRVTEGAQGILVESVPSFMQMESLEPVTCSERPAAAIPATPTTPTQLAAAATAMDCSSYSLPAAQASYVVLTADVSLAAAAPVMHSCSRNDTPVEQATNIDVSPSLEHVRSAPNFAVSSTQQPRPASSFTTTSFVVGSAISTGAPVSASASAPLVESVALGADLVEDIATAGAQSGGTGCMDDSCDECGTDESITQEAAKSNEDSASVAGIVCAELVNETATTPADVESKCVTPPLGDNAPAFGESCAIETSAEAGGTAAPPDVIAEDEFIISVGSPSHILQTDAPCMDPSTPTSRSDAARCVSRHARKLLRRRSMPTGNLAEQCRHTTVGGAGAALQDYVRSKSRRRQPKTAAGASPGAASRSSARAQTPMIPITLVAAKTLRGHSGSRSPDCAKQQGGGAAASSDGCSGEGGNDEQPPALLADSPAQSPCSPTCAAAAAEAGPMATGAAERPRPADAPAGGEKADPAAAVAATEEEAEEEGEEDGGGTGPPTIGSLPSWCGEQDEAAAGSNTAGGNPVGEDGALSPAVAAPAAPTAATAVLEEVEEVATLFSAPAPRQEERISLQRAPPGGSSDILIVGVVGDKGGCRITSCSTETQEPRAVAVACARDDAATSSSAVASATTGSAGVGIMVVHQPVIAKISDAIGSGSSPAPLDRSGSRGPSMSGSSICVLSNGASHQNSGATVGSTDMYGSLLSSTTLDGLHLSEAFPDAVTTEMPSDDTLIDRVRTEAPVQAPVTLPLPQEVSAESPQATAAAPTTPPRLSPSRLSPEAMSATTDPGGEEAVKLQLPRDGSAEPVVVLPPCELTATACEGSGDCGEEAGAPLRRPLLTMTSGSPSATPPPPLAAEPQAAELAVAAVAATQELEAAVAAPGEEEVLAAAPLDVRLCSLLPQQRCTSEVPLDELPAQVVSPLLAELRAMTIGERELLEKRHSRVSSIASNASVECASESSHEPAIRTAQPAARAQKVHPSKGGRIVRQHVVGGAGGTERSTYSYHAPERGSSSSTPTRHAQARTPRTPYRTTGSSAHRGAGKVGNEPPVVRLSLSDLTKTGHAAAQPRRARGQPSGATCGGSAATDYGARATQRPARTPQRSLTVPPPLPRGRASAGAGSAGAGARRHAAAAPSAVARRRAASSSSASYAGGGGGNNGSGSRAAFLADAADCLRLQVGLFADERGWGDVDAVLAWAESEGRRSSGPGSTTSVASSASLQSR